MSSPTRCCPLVGIQTDSPRAIHIHRPRFRFRWCKKDRSRWREVGGLKSCISPGVPSFFASLLWLSIFEPFDLLMSAHIGAKKQVATWEALEKVPEDRVGKIVNGEFVFRRPASGPALPAERRWWNACLAACEPRREPLPRRSNQCPALPASPEWEHQ